MTNLGTPIGELTLLLVAALFFLAIRIRFQWGALCIAIMGLLILPALFIPVTTTAAGSFVIYSIVRFANRRAKPPADPP